MLGRGAYAYHYFSGFDPHLWQVLISYVNGIISLFKQRGRFLASDEFLLADHDVIV